MIKQSLNIVAILTFLFLLYLFGSLLVNAFPALTTGKMFNLGYWDYRSLNFSVLGMLFGTIVVSCIAFFIAIPLGLSAAVFLSEFLRGNKRYYSKFAMEMLAGIPSVIFGLLGVTILVPLMQKFNMKFNGFSGNSLLTAGILLAFMILPTMITFTDDAFRCVSKTMRDQGYVLGLTKLQVISKIVLPQAKQGIIAAALLSLGRALGETIAIYLVIGRSDILFNRDYLSFNSLFNAGQSLTTKLGGSEIAIAYGDPEHWQNLMALGVLLWAIVLFFSILNEFVNQYFRESS